MVEFVEELDLNYRMNLVFNLEMPCEEGVYSSVNGLLFCCQQFLNESNNLFVCNPITREYITLDHPKTSVYRPQGALDTYGFGVSRISGQYKLVRLFFEIKMRKPVEERFKQVQCKVYTIGTGSWRRIVSPKVFHYEMNAVGAFLNGNLHWLTRDWNVKGYSARVLCLDLETELFTSFSTPLDDCDENGAVSTLGDCLYLCHAKYFCGNACFWLMKEYRKEKSWTKLFNINWKHIGFDGGRPIKVFRDGDMLIEMAILFYYSNKTETIRKVETPEWKNHVLPRAVVYTPSFVPLKILQWRK